MTRRTRYLVAGVAVLAHAAVATVIGVSLHGYALLAVATPWIAGGLVMVLFLGDWANRGAR